MAINVPRARETGGYDPLIGMESRNDRQNTQDPLRGTLNGLDQKIAMGNAMDSLSNTERYQLANPGNAPYSAASVAPGSSAAASAERTTNSIMTTLRDNIATQRATTPATASLSPPAGAPAFADGGSVTSEADEYARKAAEIEAEQLRQAGVKPKAAGIPAPEAAPGKPKSLLGGVVGLFSKRKAAIDAVAGYADGGSITSEADEYARQAAEIEAEQLRQAGVKPKAAAAPAQVASAEKPKSLISGVASLFSRRKDQIDAAANYASGGVVGFDAGGSLDPTLNDQITQARLGNAGGASPETALRQSAAAGQEAQAAFDAEVRARAPGVAKYSAPSTPSVAVQPTVSEQITQARLGNAGGVPPEALARQQLAEQAATVARNDAEVRARVPSKAPSVPASASAPSVPSAASVPSAPSMPSTPSPAVTPGVTSAASVPPTAGSARIGGVPGVDGNRWSTASGMQGPGNTPADVQAQATRTAENTKFAEEVKARTGAQPQSAKPKPDFVMEDMDGKGAKAADSAESARAKADTMRNAKPGASASGAAEQAAGTAAKAESGAAEEATTAAKTGRVAKGVDAAKSMLSAQGAAKFAKAGLAVAPAIGAYEAIAASDGEVQQMADKIGVDNTTRGGRMLANTANFLDRTGNAATFGMAGELGEAIADATNNPAYDQYYKGHSTIVGGLNAIGHSIADRVTGWWNSPVKPDEPAKPATPPADGSLEKSVLAASGQPPSTAPAGAADPRFTADNPQPGAPDGAIRVGPATGAVAGTATVSADQMTAPQRGGYITGPDGRALFVPESAPAARDPNGTYDAYGNNRAPTIQMQKELRDMQRAGFEADLKSTLPFYQARGMRGLTALNSDPDVAAENAQALEQTRAQNRTAELQTQAGLEGIAAQELTSQLQGVTDPAKRQALIDQATATKGRYTLVQDEETETPMGTKLKGRQRIWDNKLGRYADDGRQEQAAAPTADEVAILKKNNSPAFIKVFEEKYGKGAAEKALRGFAHGGRIGGCGKFAGGGCVKLANGGEVIQGAGSGTSDSVAAHVAETGQPIRVSQGEYELSPEVVARVGVEKLNALIDKYHKGESRAVPQGSFIIPADVVNRLGRSYFDYLAKPK